MYQCSLINDLRGGNHHRRNVTIAGVNHDERCLEAADEIEKMRSGNLVTERQIIAGARAYDSAALICRGWTEKEIESALRISSPSEIGIATARIILEAALTPKEIG